MRAEIQEIIDALMPVFKEDFSILRVYLFGSQARGDSTISSDVDFAIVSSNPQLVDRRQLNYVAEGYPVECDFVYTTPERIDSAFRELDVNYSIKREGVLIWQR